MESDAARRPQDAPQVRSGPGMAGATFRCGACGGYRSLFGRRMRPVQGLRQYVCAQCANAGKAANE